MIAARRKAGTEFGLQAHCTFSISDVTLRIAAFSDVADWLIG
jgi:hypothetical protein